jgi:RNA polymerase sigma factor (sigma-70 family)
MREGRSTMNLGKTGEVGRQLEVLWTSGTLTGLSDSQLLSHYVNPRGRDAMAEAAFRELVNRHGPMVLAVCRQLLRHPHDADDAFQATFLVLVRQARSIRVDQSLAPWLSSVAYRTARRARAIAARYRPLDAVSTGAFAGPAPDEAYHFDVRPMLHEELDRLPGKFRDVIVLCHLEGRSHEEAARLLRWPIGTVSSRLSRGRRLLRSRLERRGLEVAPAMLAANWLAGTPAAVAPPLLESTVTAAVGSVSAKAVSALVLSLTHGVLKIMWLRKLKSISLAVLLIGGTMGTVGVWAHWPSGAAKASALRHGAAPAPAGSVTPARDAGSDSQQAQPPAGTQSAGDDARLADCSSDCPAACDDGPPPYCPIAMAANAVSKVIGYFHSSSGSSR